MASNFLHAICLSDRGTELYSRKGAAVVTGSSYAELLIMARAEGLLKPRRTYYSVLIAGTLAAYLLTWAVFIVAGDTWYQLITAFFAAVTFAQSAFIVHDAGHRQVARLKRSNDVLGILYSSLLLGFGYDWWVRKHHRHHTHPNHLGRDPDVINKFILFDSTQVRYQRWPRRFVLKNQAILFAPFSLLQALSMRVHSIRALLCSTKYRRRVMEGLLITLHTLLYGWLVWTILSPLRAVVFIVVHQALLGLYLVCAFAPNHKGMPTLKGDVQLDFMRRQILTSRNVKGGLLLDYLLGGLNYQIEHHLFPSMARPNLRRAQIIVRRFCLENDISYTEVGLVESFREVLGHLHTVGREGSCRGTVGRPVGARPGR